jgi:hypothetical protein
MLRTLLSDLNERGGFNLLQLGEDGQLQMKQNPSGQADLICPPEFEGTWQQSTALLMLLTLKAGHRPKK